ncbi:MAG: hypothetical protein A2231_02550 [Candidatus Firestonebacteria bacterium RIFOXYA2_FULL_40_8]|nr:MAG: hypothetical protein A2231_02550 [Candidatus Firestonebacteria bacterium RIFOXYA2_FULL_40_8]
MNKIVLLALIILSSVTAASETFDIKKIAEKAKQKFSVFMNDEKNIQFESIETWETSRMVYKKKNEILIELITSCLSPDLKTKQTIGKLFYDETIGSKFVVSKEPPIKFSKSSNDFPLGGGFYIVFKDWWNLDLRTAHVEKIERIGSKDCYLIKFDELDQVTKNYRIWVDMKEFCIIKEEIKNGLTNKSEETKYTDFRRITDTREMAFVIEHYYDKRIVYKTKINLVGNFKKFPDNLFKEFDEYIAGIKKQ